VLTVGQSVNEAAWWFIAFEHSARVQFLAETAGEPQPADPDDARAVRDTMGTPRAAWFSFEPLYRQTVQDQPGVLD
jgi:ribulose-5-phosphate 4-epimerase/fuculose-1-phosphate aldolase